ncbi:MAG: methylamine utilization protein [Alphaproteobacteria bacterium]|nr:methylamine utilization protein [Alphaproteobacteria bacterium]MBU1515099.1 methylamine utilization protein [Alphaproteobacteria bacterium]MBU2093457.1 methylamine utilization protein [Alphaproteobacteria bacterium]MBU2152305.1 methylamine utilization protein [Alphaproteobacteria bacterium]MBU2308119.1 methylamine utilization protein [Alphaproteobacteria bacterium]
MRTTMLALAALFIATSASAGDVTVDVRDTAGKPVPNAVVMIRPAGGVPAGKPMKVSWPMVMAQQNIQFAPYVLIVPLGSSVSFPNKDKVRHHVYSFSAPKKFELKLYGKDESRSIVFDKPGAVSLGCNIHDTMIAFIYVTETPYAMKSGADGAATVQDVPAGGGQLMVWHPDLKAKVPVGRALAVAGATQRTSIVLDLRPSLAR